MCRWNWYAYNNVGMNIFVRIMAMNTYLTTSGFYFGLFSQVRAAASLWLSTKSIFCRRPLYWHASSECRALCVACPWLLQVNHFAEGCVDAAARVRTSTERRHSWSSSTSPHVSSPCLS